MLVFELVHVAPIGVDFLLAARDVGLLEVKPAEKLGDSGVFCLVGRMGFDGCGSCFLGCDFDHCVFLVNVSVAASREGFANGANASEFAGGDFVVSACAPAAFAVGATRNFADVKVCHLVFSLAFSIGHTEIMQRISAKWRDFTENLLTTRKPGNFTGCDDCERGENVPTVGVGLE